MLGKFEVNKEYRIEFDSKEYGHTIINRALIRSVDIESNTIGFEPLIDRKQEEDFKPMPKGFSFTMSDVDGNTVLKVD